MKNTIYEAFVLNHIENEVNLNLEKLIKNLINIEISSTFISEFMHEKYKKVING